MKAKLAATTALLALATVAATPAAAVGWCNGSGIACVSDVFVPDFNNIPFFARPNTGALVAVPPSTVTALSATPPKVFDVSNLPPVTTTGQYVPAAGVTVALSGAAGVFGNSFTNFAAQPYGSYGPYFATGNSAPQEGVPDAPYNPKSNILISTDQQAGSISLYWGSIGMTDTISVVIPGANFQPIVIGQVTGQDVLDYAYWNDIPLTANSTGPDGSAYVSISLDYEGLKPIYNGPTYLFFTTSAWNFEFTSFCWSMYWDGVCSALGPDASLVTASTTVSSSVAVPEPVSLGLLGAGLLGLGLVRRRG